MSMLDTAIEAAKQGGELAFKYFQKQTRITYKIDGSPVTIADRETEKLIMKIISQKFPDHGFIGEECGVINHKAKYIWAIDPIDGTKGFIRGMNTWGTLLALLKNGKPIIGVYASPATQELFWAEKDKGTYLNGKRLHVSKIADLSGAYLIHGAIHYFKKKNKLDQLTKLVGAVQGRRGSSDSDASNLLLKGQVDIFILGHTYLYDIAAHVVLVEEAGGKFSDFDGNHSLDSDCALFSNGKIHNQVLEILNS